MARALLTEALDSVERTGERWYEAELGCRMGEVDRADVEPSMSLANATRRRSLSQCHSPSNALATVGFESKGRPV